MLTAACAAFQGHQIPKIDPAQSKQVANKPTVYVEPKFFTQMGGNAWENFQAQPQFLSYVKNAFADPQVFSRFTTDGSEAKDMDLMIRIKFTNYGSPGSALVAGLITGLFLGTIPTWVTDHYRLEAVVSDPQGNSLKEYKFEDHVKTWFHLIFLPFSGSVKKVSEKVITNMLRFLIQEISTERILAPYFQKGGVGDKKDAKIVPDKPSVPQKTAIPSQEKIEIRVIAQQAVIRLHPDPDSPVISPVPMGAKLDVKEKKGNWYHVSFIKEGLTVEGYILQDSVEVIKDMEGSTREIWESQIAIFPQ